mmetsp:Transcript_31231/g.92730  ORF Transcript_31231/g.92730 Transcript_31231/m.92730 type:complete len:665 (-) Transcript_31231:90-2084(-)
MRGEPGTTGPCAAEDSVSHHGVGLGDGPGAEVRSCLDTRGHRSSSRPGRGAAALIRLHLLLLGHVAERSQHLVVKGHKGLLVVLLGLTRHLELHVRDLLDHVLHVVVDGVPADLLLAGELRHALLRRLVEADDDLHHADRLRQRAHEVVVREAVLLQEVLADDLRDLKGALLVLGQRVLADQLHDLLEVVLLLQDLLHLLLQHAVLGVVPLEVGLQDADVLGEGDVPVHGREVLALGELLVKAPEDLHNGQRRGRHGVREVATGRGHRADDGDRALARRVAQALHAAAALVEAGQTGAQVRGVAGVRGHLSETAGDLAEGLGPTRRAVGHHRHVVALVAEVLGGGHTRVDGGLAGGHGHVRGVGHERGTLHDRLLLAVNHRGQLGEVREHLGHLVAALAAADIDDDVRVRVLGEGLRDHRLAAAEGAGHGRGAALRDREEGVDDALAREQRGAALELLHRGPGLAHRPPLEELHHRLLAGLLHLDDIGVEGVLSGRLDALHPAADIGVHHDEVLLKETILAHHADDVAARHQVADLHVQRLEVPELLAVQGRHVDAARHEDALRDLLNALEGALDAVVDTVQDARAELEGEREAGLHQGVAHGEAGGVLVHLDGGGVALETDNLADERVLADADHLVHLGTGHVLCHDERAGHLHHRANLFRHC